MKFYYFYLLSLIFITHSLEARNGHSSGIDTPGKKFDVQKQELINNISNTVKIIKSKSENLESFFAVNNPINMAKIDEVFLNYFQSSYDLRSYYTLYADQINNLLKHQDILFIKLSQIYKFLSYTLIRLNKLAPKIPGFVVWNANQQLFDIDQLYSKVRNILSDPIIENVFKNGNSLIEYFTKIMNQLQVYTPGGTQLTYNPMNPFETAKGFFSSFSSGPSEEFKKEQARENNANLLKNYFLIPPSLLTIDINKLNNLIDESKNLFRQSLLI